MGVPGQHQFHYIFVTRLNKDMPVDTSDFQYKLDPMKTPEGLPDVEDTDISEYTDVDSYEGNKSYALINMKRLVKTLEGALNVSLKLGDDSNNTAALGKIAEIARVILDTNSTIVDISRKDVEMKEEKEKARKAEQSEGQFGAGMSTKDIIKAIREIDDDTTSTEPK